MRILKVVLIGVLTLLATGGAVLYYSQINAEQQLETKVSTANIRDIEQKIHDQVNAERAKYGLKPLWYNQKLIDIARAYSQLMARENFFAHEDLQGRDFADRYSAAAFNCSIKQGNYIHTGGENLYSMHVGKWISPFGYVLEYYTPDEMAHEVVKGWMNSQGHKENILRDAWQSEGIGVAIAQDGKVYVTQNFC